LARSSKYRSTRIAAQTCARGNKLPLNGPEIAFTCSLKTKLLMPEVPMAFHRLRVLAGLVVAAALTFASCDSPNEPTLSNDDSITPSAAILGIGTDGQKYKLLEGQIPATVRTRSAWIGPLGGLIVITGGLKDGKLTLHSILVPPLAVLKSTLFTVTLPPGNIIAVQLRAQQKSGLFGTTLVDVKRFNLPVVLTMSYAWATNLINPKRVVLVFDPENGGPFVRVPGLLNLGALLYVAPLSHFSKYAIAEE
jgi:hypothetical protein